MNPEQHFAEWFEEAERLDPEEAARCFVATASVAGQPSVRVVYHRPGPARRVRFFTNYESRKGQEIAENAQVGVAFHWAKLKRQVRLEGVCAKVSPQASDEYFAGRLRASQIASSLSPQSRPIASIDELRAQCTQRDVELGNAAPIRPAHWGGYELMPVRIEFWHSGDARLHERQVWSLNNGVWTAETLAP